MIAKVFLGVLMTSLAVEMILSCRSSYQHKQCYCDCDDNLFIPCTTNCSLAYTDHTHLNHCKIRCHDHLAHCLHVCNNPDVLDNDRSRKIEDARIQKDLDHIRINGSLHAASDSDASGCNTDSESSESE